MDNSDRTTNIEPELITIIEGAEPDFEPHNDIWALSLLEGTSLTGLERCRLRTFNGPALVERCRSAWDEGRPVLLDYPNRLGLRRQRLVAAARSDEVSEGMILHLWIRVSDSPETEDS